MKKVMDWRPLLSVLFVLGLGLYLVLVDVLYILVQYYVKRRPCAQSAGRTRERLGGGLDKVVAIHCNFSTRPKPTRPAFPPPLFCSFGVDLKGKRQNRLATSRRPSVF